MKADDVSYSEALRREANPRVQRNLPTLCYVCRSIAAKKVRLADRYAVRSIAFCAEHAPEYANSIETNWSGVGPE